MGVFVGVDWGCGAHAVCVIDAKGMVLERFEASHDQEGLQTLVTRLKKHGEPGDIPSHLIHKPPLGGFFRFKNKGLSWTPAGLKVDFRSPLRDPLRRLSHRQ